MLVKQTTKTMAHSCLEYSIQRSRNCIVLFRPSVQAFCSGFLFRPSVQALCSGSFQVLFRQACKMGCRPHPDSCIIISGRLAQSCTLSSHTRYLDIPSKQDYTDSGMKTWLRVAFSVDQQLISALLRRLSVLCCSLKARCCKSPLSPLKPRRRDRKP